MAGQAAPSRYAEARAEGRRRSAMSGRYRQIVTNGTPPPTPPPTPGPTPGPIEPTESSASARRPHARLEREPTERRRADWLPFVVVGAVLAVLALVGCLAGTIIVVERDRKPPPPPPIISPAPRPSVQPTTPGGGPSGDGSDGPPGNALFRR